MFILTFILIRCISQASASGSGGHEPQKPSAGPSSKQPPADHNQLAIQLQSNFTVSFNFVNTLNFSFRLIYGVIRVSNFQMNFLILQVKFDISLLPETVDGARAEQCLRSLDRFWVLYFASVSAISYVKREQNFANEITLIFLIF